jgi:hypothetical protein
MLIKQVGEATQALSSFSARLSRPWSFERCFGLANGFINLLFGGSIESRNMRTILRIAQFYFG